MYRVIRPPPPSGVSAIRQSAANSKQLFAVRLALRYSAAHSDLNVATKTRGSHTTAGFRVVRKSLICRSATSASGARRRHTDGPRGLCAPRQVSFSGRDVFFHRIRYYRQRRRVPPHCVGSVSGHRATCLLSNIT